MMGDIIKLYEMLKELEQRVEFLEEDVIDEEEEDFNDVNLEDFNNQDLEEAADPLLSDDAQEEIKL